MATQNESYKIVLTIDGKDNTSQALNSVNKQLGDMQSGVNSTTQSWNKFKDGVGMAMGAFAIAGGVAAAVGQVNELGRAANAADTTFTQLAGGAEAAAAGLAQLRQATGGVVDDMTLMQGANSLMLTGLAQTTQEAANLTEVAVKLGGAMGQNAADAIQNLNAALLNNSFERLDMLGISAGAVRARVNELKETGLDMSEAFAQATLEQGQIALERLGTAADVSNTAIARLTTQVTNLGQNIAQGLNVKLEEAAVAAEQLLILGDLALGGTGGIAALEEQRAAEEAYQAQLEETIELANRYYDLQESAFNRQTGATMQNIVPVELVVALRETDRELFDQISSGSWIQEQIAGGNIEGVREQLFPLFGNMSVQDIEYFAQGADAALAAVADAERHLNYQTDQTNIRLEQQAQILADTAAWDAFNNAEMAAVDNLALMRSEMNTLNDVMREGVISTGGATFFDPAYLASVQAQAVALTDEYERLKAVGESTEFELVSEIEVERAREIAESANDTAEQAERNARAWETASLAMIAGATGGGRLNEFNQMVLGQIEDPELRAQAEGQFNLASGVETANTRVLEYGASLVTAITETFGVAAGTRAGQDFVSSFEEGVQMGLEGEALQDYVENAVGYALGEGGGQEIQVQAGEGYIALAQRTGLAREDIEAATGGARMLHAGEIIQVGDGSSLIAVNGDPQQAVYALNSAENQVMNQFAQAPMTEPAYAGLAPYQAGQYTYYDPASMGYTQSTQSAAIMPPEQGETLTMAAENMLIIQDSALVLSETDLSPVFDPMTGDIQMVNSEITELENGLERVGNMEMRIQLPLEFVFDTVTAEIMSRNTQVVELFKLVLPQIGIALP